MAHRISLDQPPATPSIFRDVGGAARRAVGTATKTFIRTIGGSHVQNALDFRDALNFPPPPEELKTILEYLSRPISSTESLPYYQTVLMAARALFLGKESPWIIAIPIDCKENLERLITEELEQTNASVRGGIAGDEDTFFDVSASDDLKNLLAHLLNEYTPAKRREVVAIQNLRTIAGLPETVTDGKSAMNYFIPMLGDFIKQTATLGATKTSDSAKQHLATIILAAFEAAVPDVPEKQDLRQKWKGLLTALQEGKGSWTELQHHIAQDNFRFSGLKIPLFLEIPEQKAASREVLAAYRDLAAKCANGVDQTDALYREGPVPAPRAAVHRNFQEFQTDQARLINNATYFLTVKLMNDLFLSSSQDYLKSVRSAIQDSVIHRKSPDQILKETLLKRISETMTPWTIYWVAGFFKQIFAQGLWWIFSKLIHSCIENLYNYHVEEFQAFIEKDSKEGFERLRSRLVQGLTRYFSLLEDVYYQRNAQAQPGNKTHDEKIEELIGEMFTELASIYTDFFHLELQAATKSRWLSKISMWLLFGTAKKRGEAFTKLIVSSLADANEYKHPLNTILLDVLKQFRKQLEQPEGETRVQTLIELKPREKANLDKLCRACFNVLPKDIAPSKSDLQKEYQSNPIRQIGENLIAPKIMEKASIVVTKILDSIATQERLTSIIQDSAYLANQVFEPLSPASVSPEQTAKELTETIEALLTYGIKQTVDDILNTSKTEEERKDLANQLIEQLKAQTLAKVASLRPLLELPTETRIGSALEETLQAYETWGANTISNYKGNPHLSSYEAELDVKFHSHQQTRHALFGMIEQIRKKEYEEKTFEQQISHIQALLSETNRLVNNLQESEISALLNTVGNKAPRSIGELLTPNHQKQIRHYRLLEKLCATPGFFPNAGPETFNETRRKTIQGSKEMSQQEKQAFIADLSNKTVEDVRTLNQDGIRALEEYRSNLTAGLAQLEQNLNARKQELQQAKEAAALSPEQKGAQRAEVSRLLDALETWTESAALAPLPLTNIEPTELRTVKDVLRRFLHSQLKPTVDQIHKFMTSDRFFQHGVIESVLLQNYVEAHRKV